jgi:hypothetical protein
LRWCFIAAIVSLPAISTSAVAQAGQSAVDSPFSAQERSHWAYRAVVKPTPPQVRHSEQVRTPIDAFVLSRLEQSGLSLSKPAEKRDLLRRLKFDLLGLPPTPEEIDRFLGDESPAAYERIVDRFLASPRYGETWGRHWLDVVRFAETAGFNADPIRPLAYKYRDYVIRSFNRDTPFQRFIEEQIAGDELYPERVDAWIATGYLRMWPDESNASNVLLARQDALNDLTANVGSVFLGASLGCAQCHDHKFDPILQTDFYQMQAFLVGSVWPDSVAVGTGPQLHEYRQRLDHWLDETKSVRQELHEIEQSAEVKASHVKRRKFPAAVLQAIDTATVERTAYQRQLAFWSERQIVVTEKQLLAQMSKPVQQRRAQLKTQLIELNKQKPLPPASARVMACVELPTGVPKTELLAGGGYQSPLGKVEPAALAVINTNHKIDVEIKPPRTGTSGRRTALARWLTDPRNPLTARVMVNRVWQGHFGRGLVENANDFGTRTQPPSHPELLDWLAGEFIESGWSIKSLHRLILCSAVYRQATLRRASSTPPTRGEQVDPANQLYWHFPRRRLTAEAIRDALLAVSGGLSDTMYGPGVRPQLPPKYSSREKWDVSKNEADRNRRSVYIFAKRNLPYPLLKAFDFPDMHESCARRAQTTVAPQSLMLLNSEMVTGYAQAMAARLLGQCSEGGLPKLVDEAYRLAFARPPAPAERKAAVTFIEQQQRLIEQTPGDDKREVSAADRGKLNPPALAAGFADFCHALLNSNEFLFVE